MAPDNSDPDEPSEEPSDESSESPADVPRGLLEQIRAVIDALAEIEEEEGGHRRESGRIDHERTRIDYEYDVSIGLGLGDRPASPREQPDADRSRSEQISPEKSGAKKAIHIETREVADDELVVIADLPGVTDEELDVTLNADEPALELTADGEIIDRIGLNHPNMAISDVSLTNQILEIRLTQSPESNGEGSDDR